MGEYKLEEQTLRVMMEESTSCRRSNAGKGPKDAVIKLESSLKKILFGDRPPVDQEIYDEYTAAEHCLETLVQRRIEWDKFICNEDLPLASSIPSSWVIPPSHPASGWKKLQGQN
ncbi:programmed cell death protein 7-like [Palaemon carinicauda]|uniref:programmed cell death protein 7-like n=1 Tax=Palaemon carinicauda TaxID=392227 RepID=UPI0035B69407